MSVNAPTPAIPSLPPGGFSPPRDSPRAFLGQFCRLVWGSSADWLGGDNTFPQLSGSFRR